ncbi:hypothetical protein MTO96_030002 [Rhipicephalus appendiculatus]
MGESFDIGSSFFQDTVVPRTCKLKSPPLTLPKGVRGSTSPSKCTTQTFAPSPRRESYRFSGSFVLDSQTVKAMDGVTLSEDIAENAADDTQRCNIANGMSDDDKLSPAHRKLPLPTDTSAIEISAGVCSLESSTLSELFSSPVTTSVRRVSLSVGGKYEAHYLPLDGISVAQKDQFSRLLVAAKRVVVPDVLEALRFLVRPCGLDPSRLGWEDPRLAHWLLDPNQGEAKFVNMVDRWAPHLEPLLEAVTNSADVLEEAAARLSVLVLRLQRPLVSALKRANMYSLYKGKCCQVSFVPSTFISSMYFPKENV